MVLHTINTTPGHNAFDDCLRCASTGDTVLLLGDAVYAAVIDSAASAALRASEARILVLDVDSGAAGLSPESLAFPVIDMDGFAGLSEYYPRQLAWY
jgi:tRNA 2-thiouridine synthesizing protein B